MNIFRIGILLLAGALAASSFGQIAKKGNAYTFRVKYTPGQVIKLVSETGVENQGSSAAGAKLKAPMSLKVLNVTKGIATVVIEIGAGMQGKTPVTSPSTLTVKLDSLNRPTDKTGIPGVSMTMPEKPIKPGAAWTSILPVNIGGMVQRMEGRYVFAGIKKVDGHDVAVVTYALSGFANGTGRLMLLATDGSMYGNETHLSLSAAGSIEKIHTVVTRSK